MLHVLVYKQIIEKKEKRRIRGNVWIEEIEKRLNWEKKKWKKGRKMTEMKEGKREWRKGMEGEGTEEGGGNGAGGAVAAAWGGGESEEVSVIGGKRAAGRVEEEVTKKKTK